MNSYITKFLQSKGYTNINEDYYNYINDWQQYYINDVDKFHEYFDAYGQKRRMYTLGMAKRICEDYASNIYSENDEISTSEDSNKDFVKELIKKLNFTKNIPICIEKSAWSGTCGAVIRLKNAKIINNMLTADDNTIIQLIKVDAKHIIPLKIEHDEIVDVAFVSDKINSDGKKLIYIELHQLFDNGYKISNIYLDSQTGQEVENDSVISSFSTNSNTPLFSILMPPKTNPIPNNNGLGFSVYGDALDQLKACDITYHNFVMDFVLGGKKIIYNKKLIKHKIIKTTVNGVETTKDVPVYPDDISKQQFMEIGDEFNTNEKELLHEYNPSLRVEDNKNGVQTALDMLSFKAGLGKKFYEFNNGTITTATQYTGEQQDLITNAKKYRDNLSNFIGNIVRAGLLVGRLMLKKSVTENCEVLIDNADGFMEDTESIKQSLREDLALGVISKVEYRMKVYNETEQEAQKGIDKVEAENQITNIPVSEGATE